MAFGAVLVAPIVLTGAGLYWHIAAGRWMLENQAVLRIDPFSYTFAGHAWQTQDWLAEVLIALAYIGAGWSGVLALAAVAAGGGAGLLAYFLAQGRRAAIAGLWLGVAFIAAASAVKALPYLLALPCFVLWTGGLTRSGDKGPSLTLLPVMLIWANLSGTFVIGLVLMIFLAGEAIRNAQADRLKTARGWAVFAGLALVFGLITPTGAAGLVHSVRALLVIRPIDNVLMLLVALPAASVLIVQRQMWWRVIFLAGLFALALTSSAAALCFAAAAPLLAAGPQQNVDLKLQWRSLIALMVLATIAVGLRIAVPTTRQDDGLTPQSAFERVPASLRHRPVLNEPAFGGFLIFREVKPFIDNRPLYSAAFRRRYEAIADPGLLATTLSRYHIAWTILSPSNPAVKAMDGMVGWHRLYADQWAVVHLRNDVR